MNYFYMPTKVYEDTDCIWKHREEIADWGAKALIVTGKHSSRVNGSLSDVEKALKDTDTDYVIYDEVEENPSTDTVIDGAAFGIDNDVDFVIAIGGGSPMDAAKAMALLIENYSTDMGYLYDINASSESLPVIAIPTTCGTGSEVTGVSVITVHDKRTKCSLPHKIFPKLALIDGRYLKTASKKVIKDTALDALSHLWESYINVKATDYCRMIVREGLQSWAMIKPLITGEKDATEEDYNILMHAATLAGMAIAHAGTTLPHSLSYAVTYELGITHGRAVGQFLSGYLSETAVSDRNLMLSLSGFKDMEEFDNFFETVYGRVRLEPDLRERIVEEVLARKEKLAMVPFKVDKAALERIVNYK